MGEVIRLRTRPARVEDAAPFAAQMRREDWQEFRLLGEPAEDLAEGIRESLWCCVAEDEGGFVCAWGVKPVGSLLGGDGYVWCATTPRVLLHKRAFLLGSRAWVLAMRAEFPMLAGWCAADYAASVRWLTRWLGATLGATTVIEPFGVPFVNFYWRTEP